ncbi:hypothetical protein J6590_030488 [Homalodisca vitripennis]|nr:hypothetical protein J6590_030488 [Homalodisca vitripennis]
MQCNGKAAMSCPGQEPTISQRTGGLHTFGRYATKAIVHASGDDSEAPPTTVVNLLEHIRTNNPKYPKSKYPLVSSARRYSRNDVDRAGHHSHHSRATPARAIGGNIGAYVSKLATLREAEAGAEHDHELYPRTAMLSSICSGSPRHNAPLNRLPTPTGIRHSGCPLNLQVRPRTVEGVRESEAGRMRPRSLLTPPRLTVAGGQLCLWQPIYYHKPAPNRSERQAQEDQMLYISPTLPALTTVIRAKCRDPDLVLSYLSD